MKSETIKNRIFPGTKWYNEKENQYAVIERKTATDFVCYKIINPDGSIMPGGCSTYIDDFLRHYIPDLDKEDVVGSIWEVDASADEPWKVKIVDIIETGQGKGVAYVYLDEPDMTPKKLSLKNFIGSYTHIDDIPLNKQSESYFRPFQIWESVIPGCGRLVFFEYRIHYDIISCKQLLDDNTLSEEFIEFKKDEFLVAFKPTEEKYEPPKVNSVGVDTYLAVDKAVDKFRTEQESVLSDDVSTNYLKMDGEKAAFESGAIRYTKTGKGRFDLIPNDVIADIIGYAQDKFYERSMICISKADIIEDAYRGEADDRFSNTIINLIIHHYAPADIVTNDMGLPAMEVTIVSFMDGFANMMKDLAIHYENGADKYGVDNWKKGIPVTGGDRGGSFMDSAMRHLTQYLIGLEDEPHYISCIWNCMCGLWTLREEQSKKK